jgi:predicted ribosomally synthesized peptide with nif11-like leader
MSQRHAAEFFKSVKKDQLQACKLKAIQAPTEFIKMASDRGYSFNEDELEAVLEQLSEGELAAITNPGVGSRQRLVPR